jgi:protein ImuB
VPPPEPLDLLAIKAKADAEQGGKACDSPKNTGWRPGARWARDSEEGSARSARESRADVARQVAELPHHQRPPMREMGRRSEAAEMPFRRLPGDEACPERLPQAGSRRGGKSSGWVEGDAFFRANPNGQIDRASPFTGLDPNGDERARGAIARWREMPAIRYPGDGPHPDKHARRGSNDPHAAPPGVAAFFDTGRSTAGTLARVCREDVGSIATAPAATEHPLVTVLKVGSRIEIAAVSPAAAALGIEPGMALTQARASVPGLDVRDADPEGDRADLERLAIALARRWCPVVAVSDADGLFLDLTGVSHLHGGEEAMAARIVRLLARLGITARVAVADTTGAAWAMARYFHPPRNGEGDQPQAGGGAMRQAMSHGTAAPPPPAAPAVPLPTAWGGILPPGHGLAPLAALPVTALRLSDDAVELARRLGIESVGELAAMPRAPLVRRFGRAVALRLDQASGAAGEPLDPVLPPEPIAVTRRFAEPIATAEAIAHWLAGLVADLVAALAKAGQGARALTFACTRVDAQVQVLRIGLSRPSRDPAHILRLIARRIETIEPGYGIEALTLHVRRADPLGAEALGAALAGEVAPDLGPLVDTLANRIGAARLWRTRPVESDVPERTVAASSPLDPPEAEAAPLREGDVRRLDASARADPWHPRWPRPVRLLRRPEPIDHVLAELPDYPPLRFTWRGQTHRVVRGDGPERVFGEWWRRAAERHSVRDYFRVEDEAGHRFWLFRRGDGRLPETGDLSWYMHAAMG